MATSAPADAKLSAKAATDPLGGAGCSAVLGCRLSNLLRQRRLLRRLGAVRFALWGGVVGHRAVAIAIERILLTRPLHLDHNPLCCWCRSCNRRHVGLPSRLQSPASAPVSPMGITSIVTLPSSSLFSSSAPLSRSPSMGWKTTAAFGMGLPLVARRTVTLMVAVAGGGVYLRPFR